MIGGDIIWCADEGSLLPVEIPGRQTRAQILTQRAHGVRGDCLQWILGVRVPAHASAPIGAGPAGGGAGRAHASRPPAGTPREVVLYLVE